MFRSKIFGRAWLPIYNRSRKPRFTINATGSPARSSNAFVATVVPIWTRPIWAVSTRPSAVNESVVSCMRWDYERIIRLIEIIVCIFYRLINNHILMINSSNLVHCGCGCVKACRKNVVTSALNRSYFVKQNYRWDLLKTANTRRPKECFWIRIQFIFYLLISWIMNKLIINVSKSRLVSNFNYFLARRSLF